MWPENSQPDDLLCTFAASTFFYGSPMTIAIMHSLFGDSFSLSIINNPHWLLVMNDFVAIVLVNMKFAIHGVEAFPSWQRNNVRVLFSLASSARLGASGS